MKEILKKLNESTKQVFLWALKKKDFSVRQKVNNIKFVTKSKDTN